MNTNLLLFVYSIALVYLALIANLWADEAYSLHSTSKDIYYTWTQAIHFESQAPLYFIILRLWRYIDDSIWFARLLSVIFIIASLFLTKNLSKRYIPDLHPAFLTFFIGLNPFTLWCTCLIRVYSLVLLLSIIILILFHKVYLIDQRNSRTRTIYILIAVVSVFTHYFMAVLLAANALVLLLRGRFRSLKFYLQDMAIPLLLLIVYSFVFLREQYKIHTIYLDLDCTILQALKFVFNRIEIFLTNYYIFNLTSLERFSIRFSVFIILILLAIFYRNRNSYQLLIKNNIVLPIVAFTALFFCALQYNTGCKLLSTWHTSVLFIPLLLLAIITVHSVYQPKVTKGIIFVFMLYYIVLAILDLRSDRNTEFRQSAAFITKNEKKDQPVLLYKGELSLLFSYSYHGKNRIYPLPSEIDFNKPFNHISWVVSSKEEFEEIISKIPSKSKEYWLIMDENTVLFGLEYHFDEMNSFIKDKYITKIDVIFIRLRVRLISKK